MNKMIIKHKFLTYMRVTFGLCYRLTVFWGYAKSITDKEEEENKYIEKRNFIKLIGDNYE